MGIVAVHAQKQREFATINEEFLALLKRLVDLVPLRLIDEFVGGREAVQRVAEGVLRSGEVKQEFDLFFLSPGAKSHYVPFNKVAQQFFPLKEVWSGFIDVNCTEVDGKCLVWFTAL